MSWIKEEPGLDGKPLKQGSLDFAEPKLEVAQASLVMWIDGSEVAGADEQGALGNEVEHRHGHDEQVSVDLLDGVHPARLPAQGSRLVVLEAVIDVHPAAVIGEDAQRIAAVGDDEPGLATLLRAASDGDVDGSEAVTLGSDQTDPFEQAQVHGAHGERREPIAMTIVQDHGPVALQPERKVPSASAAPHHQPDAAEPPITEKGHCAVGWQQGSGLVQERLVDLERQTVTAGRYRLPGQRHSSTTVDQRSAKHDSTILHAGRIDGHQGMTTAPALHSRANVRLVVAGDVQKGVVHQPPQSAPCAGRLRLGHHRADPLAQRCAPRQDHRRYGPGERALAPMVLRWVCLAHAPQHRTMQLETGGHGFLLGRVVW